MKSISLHLKLETLPPVFKRNKHVLILLQTQDGKYLLGRKNHYPPGIARMVGGGMERDEAPEIAAQRELEEEMGITANLTDFKPLAAITATLTTPKQNLTFITYIFFYHLTTDTYHPSSDLDDVVTLDTNQFQELIEAYRHLSTDLHPLLNFTWADYGKLYSQIHQIALIESQTLTQN